MGRCDHGRMRPEDRCGAAAHEPARTGAGDGPIEIVEYHPSWPASYDDAYLFGDFGTTTVRALVMTNGALSGAPQMVPGLSYVGTTAPLTGLTSFGQDNNGELYMVHVPASGNGAIYRIDPK